MKIERQNIEYLYNRLPYGTINEQILNDVVGAGSPVYRPSASSVLEFQPRSDLHLDAKLMLKDIYEQGKQLAGEEVVDIGNGKEMVIFTTGAASPHTVLRVPYADFDRSFRQHGEELGIPLEDHILINGLQSDSGEQKPPKYMPLDMLVWTMIRDKQTQDLMPTDLSDFTSKKNGNPLIDQYRYELSRKKLEEIFAVVAKRGEHAKRTLLDLYNTVILSDPELAELLPIKRDQDILQGVVNGYFRKDEAKDYDQFEEDHRGKGPMSNPSLHFRYIAHLPLDVLKKIDAAEPSTGLYNVFDYFRQFKDYFGEEITIAPFRPEKMKKERVEQVLKKLFTELEYKPVDFVKLIDPYASLTQKLLGTWLEDQLSNSYFNDIAHTAKQFQHHTGDFEHELRVSEGVEVIIGKNAIEGIHHEEVISLAMSRASEFTGQVLYPLWDNVNEYVLDKYRYDLSSIQRRARMDDLIHQYNLPEDIRPYIDSLQPTERQLRNILTKEQPIDRGRAKTQRKLDKYMANKAFIMGRHEALWGKIENEEATNEDFIELITLEQYVQIFDDPKLNSGYNIPGVPGTATTYHFDEEGNFHLNIGWLLSMKGISELWLGAMVKRMEERNR